jgi:hypothetical protein
VAEAAGGRFGYVYGRLELEALAVGEWTRVDPWPAETAAALAAALRPSAP